MNEITNRLDLWTFTRFVDGFLGNEKFTNRESTVFNKLDWKYNAFSDKPLFYGESGYEKSENALNLQCNRIYIAYYCPA